MTTTAQLLLERDPVVHPGDVVRWTQKRGRTMKVYYARVTAGRHVAQYSATSTVWVIFTARRVRPGDHAVAIGPETEYGVAIGKLARVSRAPAAFRRVGLVGLREARPWFTAS